ncbi:hypothetical protein AMTRI_Chr11g98930 [Amborella trichopoda]
MAKHALLTSLLGMASSLSMVMFKFRTQLLAIDTPLTQPVHQYMSFSLGPSMGHGWIQEPHQQSSPCTPTSDY